MDKRQGTFEKARPGTHYDAATGKLYEFTQKSILVMRGWPAPLAWQKTAGRPVWRHVRPKIAVPAFDVDAEIGRIECCTEDDGQMLIRACLSEEEVAFRREGLPHLRWHAQIPRDVRETVSRFPERHWHLLSFMARCGPAAADLAVTNPALAFALASSWVFRTPVQRPLRSARALLAKGKKQRVILAWLGFPGTESCRKLLAKVVHDAIGVSPLLYLREGMADPQALKSLVHLPRLNRGVLRIVTDPSLERFVRQAFLEEVSNDPAEDRYAVSAYRLADTLAMHRRLYPDRGELGRLQSPRQLAELHDDLVYEMNLARAADSDLEFPPPPLEGSENIVPITTVYGLVEEGLLQQNCVATFSERIALAQDMYVYRVLWPERCTLSIVRRGETWAIGEIARSQNRAPSWETRMKVREWYSRRVQKRISFRVELPNEAPF